MEQEDIKVNNLNIDNFDNVKNMIESSNLEDVQLALMILDNITTQEEMTLALFILFNNSFKENFLKQYCPNLLNRLESCDIFISLEEQTKPIKKSNSAIFEFAKNDAKSLRAFEAIYAKKVKNLLENWGLDLIKDFNFKLEYNG